ncbi:hypothetical protein Pst134EB_012772 [Puccinia striiformis f. sp. tritici]|nr:hypothetical protein Pst134EB_012772 [Puccinia striiformis f. sp. tritici]
MASSTVAYNIGLTPSNSASKAQAKFIYLLNADDFDPSMIPKDAYVVYQGHHEDLGASYADSASALKTGALGLPIHDFYFTDPISRALITMAQCSKAFSNPNTRVS